MNNISRVSLFEKDGEERMSIKKMTVNNEFIDKKDRYEYVGNKHIGYISNLINDGSIKLEKINKKLIEIEFNEELKDFSNRLKEVREGIRMEIGALEKALEISLKEEEELNNKRDKNYEIILKVIDKIESIEDFEEYEYLIDVEGYKIYDLDCDYEAMKYADNEIYYIVDNNLEFSVVYDRNDVNIYVVNYNKFYTFNVSFFINRLDELLGGDKYE